MSSLKGNVPTALIIGTGEYVSGYVGGTSSSSDKKIGVVALVLFDLRRRGFIGRIILAGTQGVKFPAIREHFKKNIEAVYKDMDTSFDSFPADNVQREPDAYKKALNELKRGDMVFIFTPDNLHYEMAKEAISRGVNVMVTKPIVQKLSQHLDLLRLTIEKNVLVSVEVHKRFDPMYADSRQRIRNCGNFSYFSSYMSQPKFQLTTFKAWADFSDISYYLNSHHVDFHCWTMEGMAKPEKVFAIASSGIASRSPYNLKTEDTITLLVQWRSISDPQAIGTAVYTASWVAPKADVHSQQSFHYMGTTAEFRIDQAHRGYIMNSDDGSPLSINPLYMKYTPDGEGYFAGQQGYGYKSIEQFVVSNNKLRSNEVKDPRVFDKTLATIYQTATSIAILDAGRLSLDKGKPVFIIYNKAQPTLPERLEVQDKANL